MVLSRTEYTFREEKNEDYNLDISSSTYNKYLFDILNRCNLPENECVIFFKFLADYIVKLFNTDFSSVFPLFTPKDTSSIIQEEPELDLEIKEKLKKDVEIDLNLNMFPKKKGKIKINIRNIKKKEPVFYNLGLDNQELEE